MFAHDSVPRITLGLNCVSRLSVLIALGLLVEPTNVAEVLTVSQVGVLRIHTVSHLVRTGEVDAGREFEGVEAVSYTHLTLPTTSRV